MGNDHIETGDSVVIKQNVEDPDTGADIGGWQGRVTEIGEWEGTQIVTIHWDSVTLRQMPADMIEYCETNGLGWSEMRLAIDEVKLAEPRDTPEDVAKALADIAPLYQWIYLGEEGKRIHTVLKGYENASEWKQSETWHDHLEETLTFPIEAEISEWQERSPVRAGDKVKIYGLSDHIGDPYGVMVDVRHEKRGLMMFPLCDLEVLDKSSPNYQPIKDYAIWFANR